MGEMLDKMKKITILILFLLLVPFVTAATVSTCLLKIGDEYGYFSLGDGETIGEYTGEEFCNKLGEFPTIDSYWHQDKDVYGAREDQGWTEFRVRDLLSDNVIPEFATITAGIALLGAAGSFFALRRRK